MAEEICPRVIDEGAQGARLEVFSKPIGCPGLGGWKQGERGWFTRVKGSDARRILDIARRAPGNTVTLILDGDHIVDIFV